MYGGTIEDLTGISHDSTLTLFGSNFAIDGIATGETEIFSILSMGYGNDPNRIISGIWASGETFEFDFKIGNNAKIVLNTVPIPGAVWLLGSGCLGLIGWRRKKK